MDFCPDIANGTIPNTALQWRQITGGQIYNLPGSSYLRPDVGGALLPWVYTAGVIIVHIPTVIIRVQRWETVQTWCLATTLLTVVLYAQAYISTRFAADQVLTWTPLLLAIDAGSMLQQFVLVVEAGSLMPRVKTELVAIFSSLKGTNAKLRSKIGLIRPRRHKQLELSSSELQSFCPRYLR